MEGFTPFSALPGGTLIGLWASLVWIANGRRIAGILGGATRELLKTADLSWFMAH